MLSETTAVSGKVDAVERAVRIDQHLITRARNYVQRRTQPLKVVRPERLEGEDCETYAVVEHRRETARGYVCFPHKFARRGNDLIGCEKT